MSHVVWRIAADTTSYRADDLSGAGAQKTGGRWNRKDHAVLYTSSTRALACLESVVHLNAGGLPLNRYLVEITIPNSIWQAAQKYEASALPTGWDGEPASLASIEFGTDWLKANSTALLIVPSAIVPEEFNVLVNPAHAQAQSITGKKIRQWTYDPRLLRKSP